MRCRIMDGWYTLRKRPFHRDTVHDVIRENREADMKMLRRMAAVVTCVAFLGGCFQVETKVRVNPDGSGTVEERVLMNDKVIRQIDEMSKAFAGPDAKPEPFTLHDRKELQKRAGALGEGVAFVSSREISSNGYTGYRAVYSFRDINTLRLSQEGPKKPGDSSGEQATGGGEPFLFRFTPGKEARLVVIPPRSEPPGRKEKKPQSGVVPEGEEGKPALTPQQEREAMEMVKGMRFSLVVEVNGTVLSSNATHRDGSRITLFEFDLDRMGNDPEKLRRLKELDPTDFAGAKEMVKAFPGIKAELNDRIEIVFSR